ncbi:hypothetical protein OH76DRAFT_601988 [Lentinus brumalis]|uniref:Uncharacterized protein n=1 Tax=Lentinus brumalis TaxID=2498619 RepID=A0A371DUE4_9APHY|nr:hypothetical protein OH76DRAFT_601988 [Polyporus brumalis]
MTTALCVAQKATSPTPSSRAHHLKNLRASSEGEAGARRQGSAGYTFKQSSGAHECYRWSRWGIWDFEGPKDDGTLEGKGARSGKARDHVTTMYVTVIFHSDSDRLSKYGKDRPIVQVLQICRSTEHSTAGTALLTVAARVKPEPGQRPDRIRESTSALGTYPRGSSTTSTRRVARILALIGVGQRPGGRRLVAYMERR